ncbi:MAG: DUF5689 domain-containing protein [Bacteroidales bacterium]|jgi:hypothetical protein|nr:DUF5689 domain-containing protein [Bacteroidales bacterium]
MKKITTYIAAGLLVAVLASCAKNFDRPPFTPPVAPDGWVANITIEDLIDRYNARNSYAVIEDTLYIEGVVTANDVSGNVYKKMFIQDTNEYGLDVELDMTAIWGEYPVGQRVIISLRGLSIGNYGNMAQIGLGRGTSGSNPNATGRITDVMKSTYIAKIGLPYPGNLPEPKLMTIAEINDDVLRYAGVLIKIDSVVFVDAAAVGDTVNKGKTFATQGDAGNGSNRNIRDDANQTLIVRNSTESKFTNAYLPRGKGCIVGILSHYPYQGNAQPQLTIRTVADLTVFQDIPTEAGGGTGENED